MENARPSFLRGDTSPRFDSGFAVYLFCVGGRCCLMLNLAAGSGSKDFLDDMDVSGTIGAILSQKSKDIFSIRVRRNGF